jgi:hypothetical protein
MSDLMFPNNLPGMSAEIERGTNYRTTIYKTVSGGEQRVLWGPNPIKRFRLQMVLRSDVNAPAPWAAYSELDLIHNFIDQHKGSFDSFLFTDPDDNVQYRVRFAEDEISMERVVQGVWTAEIDLVTVE